MDIQGGGRSRTASGESGQALQDRKNFVNRSEAGVRSPDRKAPLDRKHVSEQVSAPAAAAVPVEASEPSVPFVSVLTRYRHQRSIVALNQPLTQRSVQAAAGSQRSPSPSDPVDPAEADRGLDNKRTAEARYERESAIARSLQNFQQAVRKHCADPVLRDSLEQAFEGETLNLSLLAESAHAAHADAKHLSRTPAQILATLPDQLTNAITAHARAVGITSLRLPEQLNALPNFVKGFPPLEHLSVLGFRGEIFDLAMFPASPPNIHLRLGNIPYTKTIRCYRAAQIHATLRSQQRVRMEILDRDQAVLDRPLSELVHVSSGLAGRLPRGRWHSQRDYAGAREWVREHGLAGVHQLNQNNEFRFDFYAPDALKRVAVVCRHLAVQQLWLASKGALFGTPNPESVDPVTDAIYALLHHRSPEFQIIDPHDFGKAIARHLSQARPGASPSLFCCITDNHVLTLTLEQLKPVEHKGEDSSVDELPGYRVTLYDPNRTYKPEARLYRDMGAVKLARLEDVLTDSYVDLYYFNESDCDGLPGYDPTGIPQRALTLIPFPDTSSWRSLDEMRAGLEAQWPVAQLSAAAAKPEADRSQVHPGRLWHLAAARRYNTLADALQAIDWSKLSRAEAFASLYGPANASHSLLFLAFFGGERQVELILKTIENSGLPTAEQERLLCRPNREGWTPFAGCVREGYASAAQQMVDQFKALRIPADRLTTLLGAGCPSGSLLQRLLSDGGIRSARVFLDAVQASGLPEVDRAVLASGLHRRHSALSRVMSLSDQKNATQGMELLLDDYLDSKRWSAERRADLVRGTGPTRSHALSAAFKLGHYDVATAYMNRVGNSSNLSTQQKYDLLRARTPRGEPSLRAALLEDDASGVRAQISAILAAQIPSNVTNTLLLARGASRSEALFVGICDGRVQGVRSFVEAVLASPRLTESAKVAVLNVGSVKHALDMEQSLLDAGAGDDIADRVIKQAAATEALDAWADLIRASSLSDKSKKRLLDPLRP